MLIRKTLAYGMQYNYWDDPECIGWTRVGRTGKEDKEGCAVLLNTARRKMKKRMFVGRSTDRGEKLPWTSVIGARDAVGAVVLDESGWGVFEVAARSAAVYLRHEALDEYYNESASLKKRRQELWGTTARGD